ncbi:MAG: PLP-dependent aspartate aminotransferase family protein [Desulfovibrio sp.]|jgi:cystathionine beta-lyase/cystathionine gamma-synthase|nr:PLP-dependent aspartate aminotransferase family protein [Desulfovibrio sp.]
MRQDTLLAQAGARRDPATGAISMPVYPSAAFQHPALGQSTGFDYSRTSNPTRLALEETVAALEKAAGASAFASGLAAIDAVMRLFRSGEVIVVSEDMYGGTIRLFEKFGKSAGLEFLYVDTSKADLVAEALEKPGVRGLFVELPTNPMLRVADIAALGKLVHEKNILFVVDNTFLTAASCRPLDLGADIVLYSATKYLGGHNDLIAGIVASRTPELCENVAFVQNAVGAILGPFESWLLLRSLKTLSLRLSRHGENALKVAEFLQDHPRIRNLRYPGLPADPGHAVLARQAGTFGGVISFEVESREAVERILASVRVFMFAESLGAAESLITFPVAQTHADMDAKTRERVGLTDSLIRLSIGLEDPDDLIADLASALEA